VSTTNINPHTVDLWIRSGQAVEAAQELAWIVFTIFIIIGVAIWRGKD
jgi:hypothetical protein